MRLPELDEEQARAVVTAVAVALFVALCVGVVLAWGMRGVVAILAVSLLATLRVACVAWGTAQQALAEARTARGQIEAVQNHLTGLEPAGTGRHGPR